MNRIEEKFCRLRKEKKKAFIAFITAGDPDLKTTERLVPAFEEAGADIVELGVPFSDPMADGPTIQAASQRALKRRVDLEKIFRLVKRIRRRSSIPIALMSYANPVMHFGEKRFIRECARHGVDGCIIPDMPPEEASPLIRAARRKDIATIFFLSPTTRMERFPAVIEASRGFIYYVSLTGVTGARKTLSGEVMSNVRKAKSMTDLPVCVGFGVSTPGQVKSIAREADGVIVGSAIIKEIVKHRSREDMVRRVAGFVKRMSKGCSDHV